MENCVFQLEVVSPIGKSGATTTANLQLPQEPQNNEEIGKTPTAALKALELPQHIKTDILNGFARPRVFVVLAVAIYIVEIKKWGKIGGFAFSNICHFRRLISIVDTFLGFPPSCGVISSVPIPIECILESLKNRFRVISATSTAVLMARPRAFRTTSSVSRILKAVITAMT